MKPFRFNLQTLWQLRDRERETALQAYAGALMAREQAERLLVTMYDRYSEQQEKLAARRQVPFQAGEHGAQWSSLHALVEALHVALAELKQAREKEQQAKDAYLQARARSLALEKLRDKRQAEHRIEEERAWEKEMDDLVSARTGRSY